jgi:hypothetical protein
MARMIESGPIPAVHGVVRWRLIDLAQWIADINATRGCQKFQLLVAFLSHVCSTLTTRLAG